MEHEYAIPDPDAEKNPYVVGQFLNPDVDPSEAFDAAFEYARTKQSEQRNTAGDIHWIQDKEWADKTAAEEADAEVELVGQLLESAEEAVLALIDRREHLLEATLNLNSAKGRYEDAKRDAYLMGTVTGKNAEEREARLASVLEVQIHNVRTAETEYLKARTALECAEDVIHHLDRTDRIMARFMPAK